MRINDHEGREAHEDKIITIFFDFFVNFVPFVEKIKLFTNSSTAKLSISDFGTKFCIAANNKILCITNGIRT